RRRCRLWPRWGLVERGAKERSSLVVRSLAAKLLRAVEERVNRFYGLVGKRLGVVRALVVDGLDGALHHRKDRQWSRAQYLVWRSGGARRPPGQRDRQGEHDGGRDGHDGREISTLVEGIGSREQGRNQYRTTLPVIGSTTSGRQAIGVEE